MGSGSGSIVQSGAKRDNEESIISWKQFSRLAIGGLAGSVAKTVVSPFERVRIMKQTGGASASQSMIATGKMVVDNEGVIGLWRGNFVNVMRVFPSRGVLFSCNDFYKDALAASLLPEKKFGKTGEREYPFWLSFLSGAMAGMTANVATYPLDIARTRMTSNIVVKGGAENSMIKTLAKMARTEGMRSWYKGVGPTLAGSLPYEGIKFAVYDWAMNMQTEHFGIDPKASIMPKLLSGGIAGVAAGVVMFPNDTVRRLMQMQGHNGSEIKYTSAWNCWVTVYREEGLQRFFRGAWPYMLRMLPNSAIQFATYNVLADKLLDKK